MTNTDGFLVARERDSIFCFDWVATKESLAGLGKARGPEGCPGFFLALPFLPSQASLLPPSTLLTPLNSHPDNFDCPHSCLIECFAVSPRLSSTIQIVDNKHKFATWNLFQCLQSSQILKSNLSEGRTTMELQR